MLERLLGGPYAFAKVLAGVDPQQLAVHTTLQRAQRGLGLGADDGVGAAAWAVDSGPLPLYTRTLGEGTGDDGANQLVLRFDAEPNAFVWQLVGARAEGTGGSLFLRGSVQEAALSEAATAEGPGHNYLDPVNVVRWEVSVALAPPETGVKWVKAPKLRLLRGQKGADRTLRR